MDGVHVGFNCTCGNEGWIGAGEISTPCDICGNIYYGIEYQDHRGITIIKAKLLQDDIQELTKEVKYSHWKKIINTILNLFRRK